MNQIISLLKRPRQGFQEVSMDAKIKTLEKGQAIIYLVLGMVVFLGFVALAIDGGMVLADRRQVQNIADAASLAGAGKAAFDIDKYDVTTSNWNCTNLGYAMNNAEYAAWYRANGNNYTISYPRGSNEHNYADATCSNAYKYIQVTVEISATTPSNFLQLFFPNALQNQVQAVTRIYPKGPLAHGNAIVALNRLDCAGASKIGAGFRGDADVDVTGGGIFSNGCLTGGGSATVDVEGGSISSFDFFGKDIFTPDRTPATVPIDPDEYDLGLPEVDSGQCSDSDAHNISSTDLMNLTNKQDVDLESGLWCITGTKDLSINSTKYTLTGSEVTIYIVENIAVTINGGAGLQLSAPTADDPSPAIKGLLIYMPPSNTKSLTINGDSDIFETHGTILAPGSHIKINGTSDTAVYESQIIGYDVELIGTATLTIEYDEADNANLPTSLELYK
jgi:hypothetical protein